MWWNILSLIWGEGKVADMWLNEECGWPFLLSTEEEMTQPSKQSLHQSDWHLKAQHKLMQLGDQDGKILQLEGESCAPGLFMELHDLVWAPMHHKMDQVSQSLHTP